MNTIALCVAVGLNIFSLPAGNTPVGTVPPDVRATHVVILDTSLFKDWVFIGVPIDFPMAKPYVIPIGWVPYAGLTVCPPQPLLPPPEDRQ